MRTGLLAAALLAVGVSGQVTPPPASSHGAFGFGSATGAEIIVLHEIEDPAALRTAICGGRPLPIRFRRRQQANGATRDAVAQFDRLGGIVFGAIGRRAGSGETCFVAADGLIQGADLLAARREPTPVECAADERRRFAGLRERKLKACWSLAAVPPDGRIGVVEYERAGANALASVVVVSKDRGILIDFPAEYKAAGEDLWRADDGGEFSPDGLAVPFVLRRGGTWFIPIEWQAAEGVSLSLFVAAPGAPARQAIADYWYRAPR